MDLLKFVFNLGDNYPTNDGINFFNIWWDIIKAIITGLIAFGSAYYIFYRGKKKDDDKETEKILNVRNTLYYDITYLRDTLAKEYTTMLAYIRNLRKELNPKNYKCINQSYTHNSALNDNLFSYYKKEDLFKILVFNHSDKLDKRISNFKGLEINIKSLNELFISIKLLITDFNSSYTDTLGKMHGHLNDFKKYLMKYKAQLLAEHQEEPVEGVPLFKYKVLLIFDDYKKTTSIEGIVELMQKVADHYNIGIVSMSDNDIDYTEITMICANIFNAYSMLIGRKRAVYETLKLNINNVLGTKENLNHILKLEYNIATK